VRSAKQAIAIGLSKARHAGVRLAPPRKRKALSSTRHRAARDYRNYRKEQGDSPAFSRYDGCPQNAGTTCGFPQGALQTSACRLAPARFKCPAQFGHESRQNQGKEWSKPDGAKSRANAPGASPEGRRCCMRLEACTVALMLAGFAVAAEHSQPSAMSPAHEISSALSQEPTTSQQTPPYHETQPPEELS